MIRRELGNSGIITSAMSMGTWAMGGDAAWGPTDEEDAIRTVHLAAAHGVDLFDTAPAYGFGDSERTLGKALKGLRGQVKIITKCGLRFDGKQGTLFLQRDGRDVTIDLSPEYIIAGTEESLKNLQTDYIDVLISHWQSRPPFVTPIVETMEAMMQLKKAGKIRAIGISNATPEQLREYMKYGQVDLVQVKYSLLTRDVERELLPLCEQNRITLQAYSPMEQGLLTGGVTRETVLREGDIRNKTAWYRPELRDQIVSMLEGWQPLCEKYTCSLSNLAAAWVLVQGSRVNAVCGARKQKHILENLRGGEILLSPEDSLRMRRDAEAIQS